eukprot:scaffold13209_cov31-Tisochrysis_lutea.AAC.3
MDLSLLRGSSYPRPHGCGKLLQRGARSIARQLTPRIVSSGKCIAIGFTILPCECRCYSLRG